MKSAWERIVRIEGVEGGEGAEREDNGQFLELRGAAKN